MQQAAKMLAAAILAVLLALGARFGVLLHAARPPELAAGAPLDAVASALVEQGRIPGISFAALEAGAVASNGTLGVADAETGRLASAETIFEAASLTKPIVAEIALRLYADGVFELDEPVAAVIAAPRIKNRDAYGRLTPRMLLAHRSGLPNWSGDFRDPARQDALSFKFPPGTDFAYSGEGYVLLAQFLEAKAGRSWSAMSAALFQELGMRHTSLVGAALEGDFARGHLGMSPARAANRTSDVNAASSLFTTADDYIKFIDQAAAEGGEWAEARQEFRVSQGTIFTGMNPNTGKAFTLGWSLGWGIYEEGARRVYFQWGDNGAFKALAAFDPVEQQGLVYLVNGSYGNLYANELAAPIVGDMRPAASWFASPALEAARRIANF